MEISVVGFFFFPLRYLQCTSDLWDSLLKQPNLTGDFKYVWPEKSVNRILIKKSVNRILIKPMNDNISGS